VENGIFRESENGDYDKIIFTIQNCQKVVRLEYTLKNCYNLIHLKAKTQKTNIHDKTRYISF